MTKNSILCNFIKNNKNTWKKKLSSKPYFLIIKEKGPLAIFNYNILAEEYIFENENIKITRWSGNIPYNPEDEFYEKASMFAPDKNIYESGAYIDDNNNVWGTKVNYQKFSCDFSIPEVQEARGIIINTETCEVVCWPFRKFGNYGESYVDNIDWNTARVLQKIDGSIIKLWYNNLTSNWMVSTNGIIDASECNLGTYNKTFKQLFEQAINEKGLDYSSLNKSKTYLFELVSPYNTVVIKYDVLDIYHIGTRNNITGEESNDNIGIQKPKEYVINSLEACMEAAEALNPNQFDIKQEGFVVVDKNYNRIKVKSPEYVAVHHMLNGGNLSKSKIAQIVLKNETEEYLSYFPQYKEVFDKYANNLSNLKIEIKAVITSANEMIKGKNLTDKEMAALFNKEFGKKASYAFLHIKYNKNVNEIIKDMTMKRLVLIMSK